MNPPSLSKLAHHSQYKVLESRPTKIPKCVTPLIESAMSRQKEIIIMPNRGSSLIQRFVILRSPGLSSDRLSVAMRERQTIVAEREIDKLHFAFNIKWASASSSGLGLSSGEGLTALRRGCSTMKTTATPRMRVE